MSKYFITAIDFCCRGMEVDFDLNRVYGLPGIENMIWSYVNFDKCRKQIIRFEDARNSTNIAAKHPKESKAQALDLLRCHS